MKRVNQSDIEVYREVQRNAETAMKAIDTIRDKVYDDDLALLLSRQNMEYSDIRNKALTKLIEAKAEPYRGNAVNDLMLKSGIHMNTMLNTSTSHVAELMIQGSSRGQAKMWKALNANGKYAMEASEMAEEIVKVEELGISAYKKYL